MEREARCVKKDDDDDDAGKRTERTDRLRRIFNSAVLRKIRRPQ